MYGQVERTRNFFLVIKWNLDCARFDKMGKRKFKDEIN